MSDQNVTIFEREDGRQIISMTLHELNSEKSKHLPKEQIACHVCPNAMWFTESQENATELQVYCRIMNCKMWTTSENINIKMCDGLEIGIEGEEE
ncbi:hypothetical protein CAY62_21330 (plasmid) [Photobacterium damselae subsp. damselae]|nr:hypothetical protein CAY62_21330 [Photobacterium damselae subsp. damselae]